MIVSVPMFYYKKRKGYFIASLLVDIDLSEEEEKKLSQLYKLFLCGFIIRVVDSPRWFSLIIRMTWDFPSIVGDIDSGFLSSKKKNPKMLLGEKLDMLADSITNEIKSMIKHASVKKINNMCYEVSERKIKTLEEISLLSSGKIEGKYSKIKKAIAERRKKCL